MRKSITQYQYRCNTATTNRSLPCIVCRISRRHTVSASRTSTAYRLKMDFFLIFLGTNETKLHLKARLLSSPVVAPERRPKRARRCMMRDRKRCSHGREKHACADCNPCVPSRQAETGLRDVQPLPARQAEKGLRGVQPLPPRQGESGLHGLQPVPARQADTLLHGLHPLPSRQVEIQLRGVQPLPSRQGENRLHGVHPLSPRQAKTPLRGV